MLSPYLQHLYVWIHICTSPSAHLFDINFRRISEKETLYQHKLYHTTLRRKALENTVGKGNMSTMCKCQYLAKVAQYSMKILKIKQYVFVKHKI